MSIESVMLPNHLLLSHPLLFLPSIFPSMRIFSKESALHIRWPKYCSFSFSISPSNEYSEMLSFRIDWFDLLAVQGINSSVLCLPYGPTVNICTWPLKRLWCWEWLKAEGEEAIRGWDGWIASLMQWTWTLTNSRRWWRTGRPAVLQPIGTWLDDSTTAGLF